MEVLKREKVFTDPNGRYELWEEIIQSPMLHADVIHGEEDEVASEVIENIEQASGQTYTMVSAYTPNGAYIGGRDNAEFLCDKKGIRPELRTETGGCCSIGKSDIDGKWYGWSHRAIYGFEVGSEVKRGDCAYAATDPEDFRLDMIRFWSEPDHKNIRGHHICMEGADQPNAVQIMWEPQKGQISGASQPYPETWGRGEWTAATEEDARQMAIDFAEGVS